MPDRASSLRELIEGALIEHLPESSLPGAERLNDALRYSLFPGGKRLRPTLTLLSARVAGGCFERALPVACAVEYLHTTSLIFDDLPAMDDASLRRGLPALHLVFGEALAQLAALALLNRTYAIFGQTPTLLAEAAACLGADGMIGGQAVDLETSGERCSARGCSSAPFRSRDRKTSALLRLTFTSGALACGARSDDIAALADAGECLGEAYQIWDDVFDGPVQGRASGKTEGQDLRHGRLSHAAENGTEICRKEVWDLLARCRQGLLRQFGESAAVSDLLEHIDGVVEAFRGVELERACISL